MNVMPGKAVAPLVTCRKILQISPPAYFFDKKVGTEYRKLCFYDSSRHLSHLTLVSQTEQRTSGLTRGNLTVNIFAERQ